MALESVPSWMSTRPYKPKWLVVPLPCSPSTPEACASSTITTASYFSANSTISGSGAISPSMLNTPSVTISRFLKSRVRLRMSSKWFMFLCSYT